MKISNYLFLFFLLVTVACSSNNKQQAHPSTKPNIIFIYADDLGRGMLGTYGQQIVKTPNIDRLAEGGIRFDNAYGCHYCAPARASLLTGMHDCRRDEFNVTTAGIWMKMDNGLTQQEIEDKIHKVIKPAKEGEVFLGQVAQQAGYATAEFGKLEWGFATTAERIKRHGWDYHFGYYDHQRCHGFYPPFLWENGVKIDIPGNTHIDCGKTTELDSPENYARRWNMEGKAVYSENIIMEKMLAWMGKNNPKETNKPFFIYFPSQLPHGPISIPEVHPDFKNDPRLTEFEKEYASMVKMLDTDVGRIYDKLAEMGILENTILIFSADNGHAVYPSQKGRTENDRNIHTGEIYDDIKTRFLSETSGDIFDGNDGMSGLKRANWEGGFRVPLFWYWKDKITPGQVSTQMVANYDLLNTIAELVGTPQIEEKDGKSYAPLLFGKPVEPRDYTFISSKNMGPAIIAKDGWKMRYYMPKNVFQLYYLPDDYQEKNELSAKYPEKLEELKAALFKECKGDWKNGLGPIKESWKLYGINERIPGQDDEN